MGADPDGDLGNDCDSDRQSSRDHGRILTYPAGRAARIFAEACDQTHVRKYGRPDLSPAHQLDVVYRRRDRGLDVWQFLSSSGRLRRVGDSGKCRDDVHGNYEPSNCRWATWAEQMRNTTRSLKNK